MGFYNKLLSVTAWILAASSLILPSKAQPTESSLKGLKPRVIITTDLGADPDDLQSLVHFLVCANEFDTEGLIVSTSCWKKSQTSTGMLDPILNAYGQVYINLIKHAEGYPTLQYLQAISKLGQQGYSMADVGSGKDSPGSELILASVDKEDSRPVWVQLWGGGNTLAQALWKVKNTRSQQEVDKFVSKIRVYDILGQDEAGAWMTKTFPNLVCIRFRSVYSWQPSDTWIDSNIQSHGALGAVYPDRKYATEGDTPAFLYPYPNGLTDPEHVDWGSWGGRCDPAEKPGIRGMSAVTGESGYDPYFMLNDATEGGNSLSRWNTAIHNDFAARMDWSIKSSYAEANHHPVAVVNSDTTKAVLQISAVPGRTVQLSAAGSSDPDGNSLGYSWKFYDEPSSYDGPINILNSNTANASLVIPSNANGKNIHMILELFDSGSPNLYAYRRVVINVIDTTRLRVMMSSDFPPFPVTNSDPDDVQSIVRFLLYSNEFDIEGMIASAGTFGMVAERKNILAALDKYDLVDENLRKHDPKYPVADALRAITYEGKGNNNGINIIWGCGKQPYSDIIGAGKDSEASEAIIAAADKNDPRPIYIGVWGGAREVAQAIWKVKNTRNQAELDAFISKLRIYLIACQDATHDWLRSNFPNLFIIESKTTYQGMFKVDNRQWVETNIINNHGPLCAIYPPSAIAGEGVIEGDSPSFLYLVSANRGINNPDDPTQPSWGGQYVRAGSTNHYIDGPGGTTISRWKTDFQAEFKERADWCLDNSGNNAGLQPDIWLEAECGTTGSLWNIYPNDSASNNKYITVQSGNNSLNTAPLSANGQVTYNFDVTETGKITLWARVLAPNTDDDSFWLGIDNTWWSKLDNIPASQNWTWISKTLPTLSDGTHTLITGYREDGLKIDKFYMTKSDTIPSGAGREAGNCSGSTGINLSPSNKSLLIYPNPADKEVRIVSGSGFKKIKVFTVAGQLVQENNFDTEIREATVGLNCPEGLYILRLENQNYFTDSKILIQ